MGMTKRGISVSVAFALWQKFKIFLNLDKMIGQKNDKFMTSNPKNPKIDVFGHFQVFLIFTSKRGGDKM